MKKLFQAFRKFIDPYYMRAMFIFLLSKQEIGKFIQRNKVDIIYWSFVVLYASILTFLTIFMPGLARTLVCGFLVFVAGYIRFSDKIYIDEKQYLNNTSNIALGTATVLMLLGLFGL